MECEAAKGGKGWLKVLGRRLDTVKLTARFKLNGEVDENLFEIYNRRPRLSRQG